jgi:hypothetical protein
MPGRRAIICGVIVLLFRAPALGLVDPNADWMATARTLGLSADSIQQLDRDGILVTGQTYKQVFEPYIHRTLPIFVTSDWLLNAYHVLYEESVLRLEQANARRLPDILRFVLANLDSAAQGLQAGPNLVTLAKTRATIVIGTALRLLDDTLAVSGPSITTIIQDEAARIATGEGTGMPDWMGPSGDDLIEIDYSRYKVRGFYMRTETLSRYFRAVAWLQSIPFRVSRDQELLAILMLASCITQDRFGGDRAMCSDYQGFFHIYKKFIGCGDDWDLITAAEEIGDSPVVDLDAMREHLLARAQVEGGPQMNDQIRFAPDDPNMVAEANFRIISAYRIPDGVLFQRTTDKRRFERLYPTGLEVCVALGSAFAPDKIDEPDKAKVLETIEQCKSLFSGSSLYFDYLNMVSALLTPPEPNSPAFMAADAWQAKNCATVLAGWAQLRHTWILQAKLNVSALTSGISRRQLPEAFVEPVPQFLDRMASLASRTRGILAAAGALGPDYTYAASFLVTVAEALETSPSEEEAYAAVIAAGYDESEVWYAWMSLVGYQDGDKNAKAARIRAIVDDLNTGKVDPSVAFMVGAYDVDLEPLWSSLEQVSRRLEAIARRQLAGADPNESDEKFLNESYGPTIAHIMLYGGNASYDDPKDDAPRIADVFTSVDDFLTISYLHVGIGRARAIYVLYPWADTEVLCKGAVLPYYEFVSDNRLTDDDWKMILDGSQPPPVPPWLSPIMVNDGSSVVAGLSP